MATRINFESLSETVVAQSLEMVVRMLARAAKSLKRRFPGLAGESLWLARKAKSSSPDSPSDSVGMKSLASFTRKLAGVVERLARVSGRRCVQVQPDLWSARSRARNHDLVDRLLIMALGQGMGSNRMSAGGHRLWLAYRLFLLAWSLYDDWFIESAWVRKRAKAMSVQSGRRLVGGVTRSG